MKKILIGGSRRISKLNKNIKCKLDQIVKKEFTVLIGDAFGVDKAVQTYLADKEYKNVLVFCMENICRNNQGNWNLQYVTANNKEKNFDYYSIKDFEMVKQSDCAFLIWDAKSKGTFNNILNLLRANKTILLYYSPDKKFLTLYSLDDLSNLVSILDLCVINRLEKQFKVSEFVLGKDMLNLKHNSVTKPKQTNFNDISLIQHS